VKTGFQNLKGAIDFVRTASDRLRIAFGVMKQKGQEAWQGIRTKAGEVMTYFTGLPGKIVTAFVGLGARIASAIGDVVVNVRISIPNPGNIPRALFDRVTASLGSASGGLFNGAQFRIIGEAGPEAVVPLNRPLSRVDPAVRALSAIAQGLAPPPSAAPVTSMAGGGIVAPRPIEVTVITPTKDPYAVSREVVNHLLASGY
jgi:hypothetical protein